MALPVNLCHESSDEGPRNEPAVQRLDLNLPKAAIVAPAFNEAGKIGAVVRKVNDAAQKMADVRVTMVVVDDASADDTGREAGEAGAHVIRHASNRGVGAAIRTGIEWAKSNHFEIVTIISGDDQHNPDELPQMLAPILKGECDFVQGSRWMSGGAVVDAPLSRRLLTRLYSAIMCLMTLRPCTDGTNGMRAFRTALLDDPGINLRQECLDGYELEPYFLYKVLTSNNRVLEVPITIRYHREQGAWTKMKPIRDWWRILRPLVYLRIGLWK